MDDEFKVVVGIMRTSNALVYNLKKTLKPYKINSTEFAVMEFLYHKGEQMIQSIRERILIASGSTTYVVDNLEKKGYVMRKPCVDDKRIYYVSLTTSGKKLIEQIFPTHSERTKKIFSEFSQEEIKTMEKLLKKIKAD